MKRTDINIRDPFVLPDGGKYYMYGTRGASAFKRASGFDVFVADELEGEWDGPFEVFDCARYGLNKGESWAPEVHLYRGKYYMFATFRQSSDLRGTYILRSDSPLGPFVPHSDGAITPYDWHSLDGTLYVSPDGKPYMVFCHEWVQIGQGTIEAVELAPDLSCAVGKPFTVIDSKNASWVKPTDKNVVTDGPFLYRKADGTLLMIWSSFSGGYITAVERSDNGDITGNWTQYPEFIFSHDGGHGMIFRDKRGILTLALHSPNKNPCERPCFIEIAEDEKNGLVART